MESTKLLVILTKIGERIFDLEDSTLPVNYLEKVHFYEENEPITIGMFNNIPEFLSWKRGNKVECSLTLFYPSPSSNKIETLFSNQNVPFNRISAIHAEMAHS